MSNAMGIFNWGSLKLSDLEDCRKKLYFRASA